MELVAKFLEEEEVDGQIRRWFAVERDGEVEEYALASGGWPDENGESPKGECILDGDGRALEEGDALCEEVRRAIRWADQEAGAN